MECFSNDMEVVLGTYKKVGGQAERMINPGYQRERESVAMQELKIDASLLEEVLYYGVVV